MNDQTLAFPDYYYILGRLVSDSEPSLLDTHDISPTPDAEILSFGPRARMTPSNLIPWTARVFRNTMPARFSTAVIANNDRVFFSRHQFNLISDGEKDSKICVRLDQIRGNPEVVYEVVDIFLYDDRDLVQGRIAASPGTQLLFENRLNMVFPNIEVPNYAYFCGWGENNESGFDRPASKSDIVLQSSPSALAQIDPKIIQSWKDDLVYNLGGSSVRDNWTDNYVVYAHKNSVPGAGDSGGGLVYLGPSAIHLLGILSLTDKLADVGYISLFAKV